MPRNSCLFKRDWLRHCFLLACYMLLALHSSAQTPSYLHYDIRDGLPSNLVYCAYQDKKGIMWFGTNNGLASFDGIRFHVYGTKDGLPDPEILGLWEDSKERLWIANFRQQLCYRKNGLFYTEKNDPSLLKAPERQVTFRYFEDKKGNIKFSGLHKTTASTDGEKFWQETFPASISHFEYIQDDLFALATTMVIQIIDSTPNVVYSFSPAPNSFLGCSVLGNRILYSLPHRLVLLELKDGKINLVDQKYCDIEGQVFSDHNSKFWVCSKKMGAVCFDSDMKNLENPKVILPGKRVLALYVDNQQNIWFCTENEGLYVLPLESAIMYNSSSGLLFDNVTCLIDTHNKIIVGGDNAMVECNEKYSNDFHLLVTLANSDAKLIKLVVDYQDRVWAASNAGLYLISKGQYKEVLPTLSAFKSLAIQNNKIWYICFSHIGYININNIKEYNRYHHGRFTAVCADINNYIWVGRNDGLYFSPDSLAYNWGNSFPPLKSRIIAIEAADSSHLWVATPTSGLLWVQIKDGTVQKVDIVNEKLKKPIDNIQSMYREDNGRLWLATNHGVYRLSPDWSVLHLDHTNGLAADDVNAVVVKGDTLWAGTVAGLSRLDLSTLGGDGEFATVISSLRFTLNDQVFTYHLLDSVTTMRFTTLIADARIVEFDLSALDYTSQGNINFEYVIRKGLLPWYFITPNNLFQWFLNGLSFPKDTTYLESGTLNMGVQLEPGRYQFTITGISGTGVRSKYPTEWTIQMAPYWYETVWVVFSFMSILIYGAIRFRKTRNFVRTVDSRILHLKLLALQAQINPHFIGNSVNSIQKFFYPFDFNKASKYITTFTRMLRQSMSFSDNSFIAFKDEVEYIENYLIMAQLRIGDQFTYEIVGAEKIPDSYPIPVMILQPFVENATIHGVPKLGNAHLILAFEIRDDFFQCSIIDDGPGIRSRANEKKRVPSSRKSRGLEIMSQKVEVLNQLFHLNMTCKIKDRSEDNPLEHGTRVDISFRHPPSS